MSPFRDTLWENPRLSRCFGRPRGFTLIELLIVAAILFTLAAIAIPNLLAAMNRAKTAKAVGDISSIAKDIEAYNLFQGKYPDTLDDIKYGDYKDPWGNPYC